MGVKRRPDKEICPSCNIGPEESHVDPWSGVVTGWCSRCRRAWEISRPTKKEIDQRITGATSD